MWRFATEATAAADTRPWSSAHGYSPKACKRIGECEMSFTCISVRACVCADDVFACHVNGQYPITDCLSVLTHTHTHITTYIYKYIMQVATDQRIRVYICICLYVCVGKLVCNCYIIDIAIQRPAASHIHVCI